MTFTNLSTQNPAGGGGGVIQFSQGGLLTPVAGVIVPTHTHHHVAAGLISSISIANLDTNLQNLLLLTADGTVSFTTGASLSPNVATLAAGDTIALFLDGGSVWRAAGLGGINVTAPRPTGGDDYSAIQALINSAAPRSTLNFRDGTYQFGTELSIPIGSHGIQFVGVRHKADEAGGTVFRSLSALRSVLAIHQSNNVYIDGITFDANRLATYAVYADGVTYSKTFMCAFMNGLLDGWTQPAAHISDTNTHEMSEFLGNGTTYLTAGILGQHAVGPRIQVAGTASTTIGNAVVPFAGAPDLTTLRIRRGDLLRVGPTVAASQIMQIESVAAAAITVMAYAGNKPTANTAGQDYAIFCGDGYHEDRQADNNTSIFIDCRFRFSGSAGARFDGLYGPWVIGGQVDFNNGVGISISDNDNATAHLRGRYDTYMEGNALGNFYAALASEIQINVNEDSGPKFAGAVQATGTYNREDIQAGLGQNYLFDIENDAGTLKCAFVSDLISRGATFVTKIAGISNAFATVPTISAVAGFSHGAGIYLGSEHILLFDGIGNQNPSANGTVSIEADTTGGGLRAVLTVSSQNVNGVTMYRPGLRLVDASDVQQNWNTTTIPAGKHIAIRVDARMK